jgi:hypothetical protein
MSDLFPFYLHLSVLLATGDDEGVNYENDDSTFQQGDKGKQPIGCINFTILKYALLI